MRRVFLAVAGSLLLVTSRVAAADWTSLRTEHFLVLGDAGPRAIKDVALRFELRAVCT